MSDRVNYANNNIPVIYVTGDSLGAGAGTTGNTYLKQLLWGTGMLPQIVNSSIGGQLFQQIAMRQGSKPIFVSGITALNGITKVGITLINGAAPTTSNAPLSTPSDTTTREMSGQIEGKRAIIERSVVGAVETYKIYSYFGNTTTIPDGARFYPDDAVIYRDALQIFWWGRNNVPDLTGLDTAIESAVSYLSEPRRYIVIGVLKAVTEITGTASQIAIDAMNATLIAAHPNNFVECTPPTVAEMAALNYTPDATDNTDIANGVIPTRMRADSTHLNQIGYGLIAMRVRSLMQSYGWI